MYISGSPGFFLGLCAHASMHTCVCLYVFMKVCILSVLVVFSLCSVLSGAVHDIYDIDVYLHIHVQTYTYMCVCIFFCVPMIISIYICIQMCVYAQRLLWGGFD